MSPAGAGIRARQRGTAWIMGRASPLARNRTAAIAVIAVVEGGDRPPNVGVTRQELMVTKVPLMVGRFPANMYLLDINPDWLISGEKQPVGVKFQP